MEQRIRFLANMTIDELNKLIENNEEFEISIKECIDEEQDDKLEDIFNIISLAATTEVEPDGTISIEVDDEDKVLFIEKVKELVEEYNINNGLRELVTGIEGHIYESTIDQITEKLESYIREVYEYSEQIPLNEYGKYINELLKYDFKNIPEKYTEYIKNNERNLELVDYIFSEGKKNFYVFMYSVDGGYDIYNIASEMEFESNI